MLGRVNRVKVRHYRDAKTKEVDLALELGAGKYIRKPYTLAKVGVAVKEELEK